mmetsp:Transcript_2393/g.6923  ORF Transcript_2393/g.6923 Transcript_2393/m.6923 type:complete len:235 (-) Transcript_2393:7-711(-)
MVQLGTARLASGCFNVFNKTSFASRRLSNSTRHRLVRRSSPTSGTPHSGRRPSSRSAIATLRTIISKPSHSLAQFSRRDTFRSNTSASTTERTGAHNWEPLEAASCTWSFAAKRSTSRRFLASMMLTRSVSNDRNILFRSPSGLSASPSWQSRRMVQSHAPCRVVTVSSFARKLLSSRRSASLQLIDAKVLHRSRAAASALVASTSYTPPFDSDGMERSAILGSHTRKKHRTRL